MTPKELLTAVRRQTCPRSQKSINETKDESSAFTTDPQDLNEIIKPNTARIIALAVLSKAVSHQKQTKNAESAEEKLNKITDLVMSIAYLNILQIATDTNDLTLMRKIIKK